MAADLQINFKTSGDQIVIGALRQIGANLTGLATNALGAAAGAFAEFATSSFEGALEAQKGIDTLTATIGRLGDKTPVTFDSALELADSFKDLVGGSDDMVLAMANVGLRFDKIGKDIFPRFIEQSADLATVLKLEPTKAAEILGKVLQDLGTDGAGSIGRLKAAGIQLTDAQEEQIKTLVEAGKVTEAQTVLMDALAATTGGAASAAAGTAAGQWVIFQETIADAGEGVMLSLMPALTALMSQALPALIPVITQVADAVSTWIIGTFLPAFMMAVAWLQANWPAIQATIAEVWAQAQPILQAVADFVVNVVIPALQTAVQWVITNWPMIQATIESVMMQIQTVIQTVIEAVLAFWDEWGDEIMTVAQGVFDFVALIFSAFSKAFEGDWRGFGEELRKAWDLLWEGIKKIVSAAIDWFKTQDWGAIGQGIIDGIGAGISAAAGALAAAAVAAAKAALDAVKGFLGIDSPSTVFAEVGHNLMAGMAKGIASGSMMPAYAAAEASDRTLSAMYTGDINITVSGARSPVDTAKEVARQLDNMGRRADARLRTGAAR